MSYAFVYSYVFEEKKSANDSNNVSENGENLSLFSNSLDFSYTL